MQGPPCAAFLWQLLLLLPLPSADSSSGLSLGHLVLRIHSFTRGSSGCPGVVLTWERAVRGLGSAAALPVLFLSLQASRISQGAFPTWWDTT